MFDFPLGEMLATRGDRAFAIYRKLWKKYIKHGCFIGISNNEKRVEKTTRSGLFWGEGRGGEFGEEKLFMAVITRFQTKY